LTTTGRIYRIPGLALDTTPHDHIPPTGSMAMHINDSHQARHGGFEHFTGDVWMDELAGLDESNRTSMLNVHFSPGARTAWHQHPRGQIMHVTQGVGLVQHRGAPVRTIRAGDTVITPAEEWHWHGATPETTMAMISIQGADTHGQVVYWGEPGPH